MHHSWREIEEKQVLAARKASLEMKGKLKELMYFKKEMARSKERIRINRDSIIVEPREWIRQLIRK